MKQYRVELGCDILTAKRDAMWFAIEQRSDVFFIFNEERIDVTYEEAFHRANELVEQTLDEFESLRKMINRRMDTLGIRLRREIRILSGHLET